MGVMAIVLASCASDTTADPVDEPIPTGNVAQFCARWPEARTTLLGTVGGETSFDLLGDPTADVSKTMISHDLTMEEVDAVVPPAIRRHWDTLYGAYTATSDLLFITNYSDLVLRLAHTTMAYGAGGHEATVTRADEAVAAIDDWAIEACGDYCARWPEFEYILRYEEHFDGHIWFENLDRYELALAAGDRLVPDEVQADWAVAVDIQRRRMTMFRDNNFSLDVDEATARAEWGVIPWDQAKAASDTALEDIQTWADANCDTSVLTLGAPGTVAVRYPLQPELGSRTLLSVLLPAGTDFADVRSIEPYQAAICSNVGDFPPEMRQQDVPAETLRPIAGQGEYFEANLCNLIRHDEQAVMPGGAYELFVGAYVGGPGAYQQYLAAPDYCLQVPVGVNGNTIVDVPELQPCNLEPIGRPEEIARRTLPPENADGRLWVEFDSALGRDGYDFCRVDAYVLAAGTTLNEIGRGEVWPAGLVNFHMAMPRHMEGDHLRWAANPGLVPILAMPASGTGEMMLPPHFDHDGTWDSHFADPVSLAAGSYDVVVYQLCASEDSEGEDFWCGSATVDVDGDTVVALPELGECP